jgi:hypothetical protein
LGSRNDQVMLELGCRRNLVENGFDVGRYFQVNQLPLSLFFIFAKKPPCARRPSRYALLGLLALLCFLPLKPSSGFLRSPRERIRRLRIKALMDLEVELRTDSRRG